MHEIFAPISSLHHPGGNWGLLQIVVLCAVLGFIASVACVVNYVKKVLSLFDTLRTHRDKYPEAMKPTFEVRLLRP